MKAGDIPTEGSFGRVHPWATTGTVVLLAVVAATIWWTIGATDREMRAQLLEEARLVSKAVNAARVASLSGSEADLNSDNYGRLKEQLSLIRSASPKCRFVYLVGRRGGGDLFLHVDSEPSGSQDESPPGQIYDEAPQQLREVFGSGREATNGPYTDRWGTWVSAFVPIARPPSQDPVAVLGMDVDARNWIWEIAKRCVLFAGLVSVAGILGGMSIALVSSRKRIQTEHRAAVRNGAKLRAMTDVAQGAFLMMDECGRISFFNPAAERMFGWTAAEAIGKDLHGLLAPTRYRSAYERGVNHFRRSGEGPAIGKTSELTALRRDGTEFPAEISLSSVCIHGAWHGVGIIRDMTESKRLQDTLRQSEERYRTLFSSSRDAIMTIEPPSWRFTSANPACVAMFGAKDEKEFTSYGPWDLSPERQPGGRPSDEQAKEMIEVALREGSHFFEWRHKRLGGEEFPATVLITRVEIGDHVFLQATVRDISEQRQLEMELNQAQKLESVGRLAAGIAHEINTPTQYVGDNIEFLQVAYDSLASLVGVVPSILRAGREGPIPPELLTEAERLVGSARVNYLVEQIPRAIGQSLEGVGRIATIVQAMKEFSHPGVAEKTPVDLNQCIRSTVTVSRNEWKYVADIELDLDSGLPQVLCLPGDFNQAILNMIVNAAHAIGDVVGDGVERKGKITVSTRQDCPWVVVQVSDTGSGIPEEIRGRIFDPFFTTKEVGRGTGQGLAIVRNVIVDKHGGTISVESQAGKGTTFTIRLPIDGRADLASSPVIGDAVRPIGEQP